MNQTAEDDKALTRNSSVHHKVPTMSSKPKMKLSEAALEKKGIYQYTKKIPEAQGSRRMLYGFLDKAGR